LTSTLPLGPEGETWRLPAPSLKCPRTRLRPRRSLAGSMPLRQGLIAALLALAMIDGLDVRGGVGVSISPGAVTRTRGKTARIKVPKNGGLTLGDGGV